MKGIVVILLFVLTTNTVLAVWYGAKSEDDKDSDYDDKDSDSDKDNGIDKGIEDDSSDYETTLTDVPLEVQKAVKYILSQRNNTWGEEISRVAILLPLIDKRLIKDNYVRLIKQRLNTEIIMNLIRNKQQQDIPLYKRARYIMGLAATCQNASNFFETDLLQIMLERIEHRQYMNSTVPLMTLALCIGNSNVRNLMDPFYQAIGSIQRSPQRLYGMQAYILIAAACVCDTTRNPYSNCGTYFMQLLNEVVPNYLNNVKQADTCTDALMLQALNAWPDVPKDEETWRDTLKDRLLSKQENDGSFGSFLATYFAIPALNHKSIYDISKVNCSTSEKIGRIQQKVESGSHAQTISITINLLVQKDPSMNKNSVTLIVPFGWSLMDALELAATKNSLFRFKYDETPYGKKVYEIAKLPNDGEKRLYWQLFRNPRSTRHSDLTRSENSGIDKISLNHGDSFVFYYKDLNS